MFSKPHLPGHRHRRALLGRRCFAKTYVGGEAGRPGEQQKRLYDFGALRLKEMDDTGIDMQVISHGAPSERAKAAGRNRGRADATRQRSPPRRGR